MSMASKELREKSSKLEQRNKMQTNKQKNSPRTRRGLNTVSGFWGEGRWGQH